MTIITEDTPTGGPDDQQWQIDSLTDQLKRVKDELERKRRDSNGLVAKLDEVRARFDDLTGRLTIGTLRKAGYTVEINAPSTCDTCGEDF
jgi:hypothetical protein